MIKRFLKKLKNRKLGRIEHESVQFVYNLNFNEELQNRLNYKEKLLRNELAERMKLNLNNSVDLVYLESFILENKILGNIDFFYNYNKVY